MNSTMACSRLIHSARILPRIASPANRGFSVSTASRVQDRPTHTGQEWDENDPRMVRFLNQTKEVNQRWAIDLIKEVPPKEVDKRVVSCDGGGGALGHPRIYINLDSHDPVSCIYCGLRFVYKGH